MNRWMVIVALLAPGCSVVGGIAGATIARHENSDGANHTDVANATVIGAAIGLAVDIAAILVIQSALNNFDFSYCGANGCDGY